MLSTSQKEKLHYERKQQTRRQPPLNPIHLTDTSATDLPVSFDVTKSMSLHIAIHSPTRDAFYPSKWRDSTSLPNILPEREFNLPLALCVKACHLSLLSSIYFLWDRIFPEYVQLVFLSPSSLSEHVFSIIEIASHFCVTPFRLPSLQLSKEKSPISLLTFHDIYLRF